MGKCFSFGNECLIGQIHDDLQHCDSFRLIGGSVVVRERDQVTATKLEIARLDKWQGTVSRARRLPVSWHDRCAALLRTRSQFILRLGLTV